jgi:hypothetical protein
MTDPLTHDQIGEMARRVAIHVHGFAPDTAPPALLGYAASLKAAASACALAAPDLCRSAPAAIFAALANLARSRLIPGAAGDKTATAYLYLQNRAVVGKPNPNGRLRMAAAAGFDVITLAVGKADTVKLGDDGDVIDLAIDPDRRPVAWADLRGVVVALTSHATGAVRRVWVSAGEIDIRKRKSSSGDKGPWASDPVGMARSKAISIAVDRGDIPQAPIHLDLGAGPSAPALPAPLTPPARALPAPAEPDAPQPPPAAPQTPQAPQDAPPPEADPTHADDAPAQPEAPAQPKVPAEPAPAAEPTWDDVGEAVWDALRPAALGAGLSAGSDDLHAAVSGAVIGARAGAESRGRPLTPTAALAPGAQARLVELALERLRAM